MENMSQFLFIIAICVHVNDDSNYILKDNFFEGFIFSLYFNKLNAMSI